MHLLVPFASALSEAGRHTLRDLALPNLDRALLQRLAPARRWRTDEYSLSPPHEARAGRGPRLARAATAPCPSPRMPRTPTASRCSTSPGAC